MHVSPNIELQKTYNLQNYPFSSVILMRMLERKNCSYEEWYAMRLQVLRTTPYALLNAEYLKEERIGYLYFWDSDYIPQEWEQWIVRPSSKLVHRIPAGAGEELRGVSESYD